MQSNALGKHYDAKDTILYNRECQATNNQLDRLAVTFHKPSDRITVYHSFTACSPLNSLPNSLLDNPHNLIRILRIKRHHMLRPMIIKRSLTRLTKLIQLHTLRVQRIQLAHDVRRRDPNRVCIRFWREQLHPRTIPRQRTAEKDCDAEERRRVGVCLAVVRD